MEKKNCGFNITHFRFFDYQAYFLFSLFCNLIYNFTILLVKIVKKAECQSTQILLKQQINII